MPASLRQALRDVAPQQVPELDFDRLWHRRQRARARRAATGVGVTVLAVATAAVGLAEVVSDDPSPRPIDDPPVQPTRLPVSPDDWERTELPDGANVASIVATSDGLVAVGSVTEMAAAWTSSDGEDWALVSGPDSRGTLLDVAHTTVGLVAVGHTFEGDGDTAHLWISTDGTDWNQAERDQPFDGAWLDAVVVGGPGVVVVGTLPEGPHAWYSADGASWHEADVPEPPDDITFGVYDSAPHRAAAFVDDVATIGSQLVAIGRVLVGDREQQFMWTSMDGRSWIDVPLDPVAFPTDSSISSIAHGPGGGVAVGWYVERANRTNPWQDGQDAAAWTSLDGTTWQRAPAGQEAFTGITDALLFPAGLKSLAANQSGYVAVGNDAPCAQPPCTDERHIAVVLTSPDGLTWRRVSDASVFVGSGWSDIRSVTTWGSRFVAVGEYDERPVIWISK